MECSAVFCQWIQLLILAVVQGVAEFLPVSSSGHLAVLGCLFRFDAQSNLALGIFLHAGSLLAVILFYFKLLCGFLKKDQLHLMLMLFIATLPVAIIGVLLKITGVGEALFDDPVVTGMAFLVTGMLLKMTAKKKLVPDQENAVTLRNITWKQALVIGFVQMAAILPGISRSGSTISAGLFSGVKREDAATFSFLLSIPVIGGAALGEIFEAVAEQGKIEIAPFSAMQIAVSVGVSFLVSLFALNAMVKVVKKSRLSAFSWYLFILGAAVLFWQLKLLYGAE